MAPVAHDILFVTATWREMKAALRGLDDFDAFHLSDEKAQELQQGQPVGLSAGSGAFTAAVTGIGTLNSAMNMGRILANMKPKVCVNLGIAGSFDLDTHPMLSICTVESETWPEFGLHTNSGVDTRGIGFPPLRVNGKPVWETLECQSSAAAAHGLQLGPWLSAKSLTVNGVTGVESRAEQLKKRYGVEIENMEGYALGAVCATQGVDFVEVRSISNLVGTRDSAFWDLDGSLRLLAKAAAQLFDKFQT
ncbi:MAG: futalosine hydrolase [Desulfovibrio sp.]